MKNKGNVDWNIYSHNDKIEVNDKDFFGQTKLKLLEYGLR